MYRVLCHLVYVLRVANEALIMHIFLTFIVMNKSVLDTVNNIFSIYI